MSSVLSYLHGRIIPLAMAKSKVKKNLNECARTNDCGQNVQESKPARSRSWIQFPVIAFVAIAIGAGAGIFAKRKFGQEEVDYSNFDASAFEMDSKELLERYKSNPKADFTPAELVNIGLEKYRQCENSYSFTIGTANTVVKQSIRNAQIKNGDRYFEEAISKSSMVSLANRVETTSGSGTTTLYKGKADSEEKASYNGQKENYSDQDYKNYLGKTLQEMFVYTISNDTVFDDSKTEKLSNGNIRVFLNLDPDISTYYYKIQMKNMSNLDGLPTFNYIKQTYTFSSDMTLLHCYIDEKYQASMGMTVSIQNTINNYYHANEYRQIPELNQSFDYSLKGEQNYE